MNKAQKVVVGFFIVSVLIIAGLYITYVLKQKEVGLPLENTLYYSFTCPHCKVVEQFIAENNITYKINFTEKEVSLNSGNAEELVLVGKYCKQGIPFYETPVKFLKKFIMSTSPTKQLWLV